MPKNKKETKNKFNSLINNTLNNNQILIILNIIFQNVKIESQFDEKFISIL